jgi:MFS family permease
VFAELWGVPYLIQGRGFTPTQASFAVSMIFLGWAIGGPITGLISDRLEQRKLPIIFGSLMAALLFSVFLFTDSIPVVVIYVLLLTFGMFSSVQNITFAIARESSADNIAGTAVAVNNMLVMFGGMLLQPFVGKMLDMQWNGVIANGHRIFDNSAYQHALLALPIGLLLAAGLVLFVKETFGKSLTDKS